MSYLDKKQALSNMASALRDLHVGASSMHTLRISVSKNTEPTPSIDSNHDYEFTRKPDSSYLIRKLSAPAPELRVKINNYFSNWTIRSEEAEPVIILALENDLTARIYAPIKGLSN